MGPDVTTMSLSTHPDYNKVCVYAATLDASGAGGQGALGAGRDAFPAAGAFVGQADDLRARAHPLGVVAPQTGQRAPLEEDGHA